MIEKHIYQCEVCGKEFAFEDECREHEMRPPLGKNLGRRVFRGNAPSFVLLYGMPKNHRKFCAN